MTFAVSCFFSCSNPEKVKEIPLYSIEQLQNNLSIRGVAFNKDESKLLTNHNGTGIYNLYELSIADTSFKPLTRSVKESFFAIDYVPETDNFIYAADQGGNENYHLYLIHAGDSVAGRILLSHGICWSREAFVCDGTRLSGLHPAASHSGCFGVRL